MALYSEQLRKKVSELPDAPGVYQYFDASGKIIYVGKAKNLKNRVSSYLNKANQTSKTLVLVSKVEDLRYIVVNSEQDALLLENNLIKKYKPKYNILLKDDKTYPWICITKEPFPKVFLTRKFVRNTSECFGPYTSGKLANTLLSLFRSLFKLRTCSYTLSQDAIYNNKIRVCLEYHINNCKAPCIGKISEKEYEEQITQIRNILKGNVSLVISSITKRMEHFAETLQFEKAQECKVALEQLKNYQSKSTIVTNSLHSIDVFSLLDDDSRVYVNYLRVVQGSVNLVHTMEIHRQLGNETKEELLAFAIVEIRTMVASESKEIIVPFEPDVKLDKVQYTVPKIGDKVQLLELSERNAAYFKLDCDRQRALRKEVPVQDVPGLMMRELMLSKPVHRMECFDNSNIQGTNPVASCVVFIDGKPAKREYRKFHIKTVVGADDFASMEEIIMRRYKRVTEEGGELPDLIVIDGGKGQLHAALKSLELLGLRGEVPIIGLAKRMEEIYFPEDKDPYLLSKTSTTLRTLMHIRDEAHRFGITFHRSLREKPLKKSQLNDIDGIGDKTVEKLIRQFKSVEQLRTLGVAEIATVVGISKAKTVYNFFHKDEAEESEG